ncbi:hypothetical protein D3C80_2187120 [compost metagenome]
MQVGVVDVGDRVPRQVACLGAQAPDFRVLDLGHNRIGVRNGGDLFEQGRLHGGAPLMWDGFILGIRS